MAGSHIQKRTCNGICKKFQVKKPVGGSRYGEGQGHCQICNTWIDHKGAHMNDGTSAFEDSLGWFCNCCNYRVRQKPRNKVYKEKLREKIKKPILNYEEMKHLKRTLQNNPSNQIKNKKIVPIDKSSLSGARSIYHTKKIKHPKEYNVIKSEVISYKGNLEKQYFEQMENNSTVEEIETKLIEKCNKDSYFKETFSTLKTHLEILSKKKIFEILNELKI